ncbi:MAG TPA: OsmC family protein [Bacteroidia bacterium]|nr:OsmC family protein [Bacteroidia bacterium]HNP97713.1 OsmC family protein [Bacteroidia bacterium]
MLKFEEPIIVTNSGEIYKTSVDTGRLEFFGDEPHEKGGADAGPTAHQLFLASLGTCTAITVRMYANRKGWDLKKITVRLNMEKVISGTEERTLIYKNVQCEGDLDEKQHERLLMIADKCPVHKTMLGPIEIKEMPISSLS